MTGRVIVVGSVNVDLVATVDHLPAPGETVTGGRFAQHHGGKGGNQAVAAARLGASTWFVGAVGADDHGTAARAALEAEGVDVTELRTLPDQATGVALILVDSRGENCIAVAGGANTALEPGHVRESLERLRPGAGDVVLVGHEIPTDTATEALRMRQGGRCDHGLQPRAGHGRGRRDAGAQRRPHAQPGRGRPARGTARTIPTRSVASSSPGSRAAATS